MKAFIEFIWMRYRWITLWLTAFWVATPIAYCLDETLRPGMALAGLIIYSVGITLLIHANLHRMMLVAKFKRALLYDDAHDPLNATEEAHRYAALFAERHPWTYDKARIEVALCNVNGELQELLTIRFGNTVSVTFGERWNSPDTYHTGALLGEWHRTWMNDAPTPLKVLNALKAVCK